MKWIAALILLAILSVPRDAPAQFFSHGQESSSIRWKQVSSDKYRVIFPENNMFQALRFASFLNAAVDSNATNIRKPITVVLHPWHPQSNGFVTLAPRRMELYAIPPQDNYPQEWLAQLAIHEYRHVVQMEQLNHNAVRVGSWVLGEQGWGAAAALAPPWFLEGDAVLSETKFSRSGRGRLPSFEQGHRTAMLSGKKYSYDKWLMGSYKDYIPNHYELGYKLVAYGELKYGKNLWGEVMDYTSRKPYTLVPFYFALKKFAGVSREKLFYQTFSFLDSAWRQGSEEPICEGKIILGQDNTSYFDDRYPVFLDDTTLVTYRTGVKLSPRFVKTELHNHGETLYKPNSVYDPIGGGGNYVAWNEYLPNFRWGQQGISKIKILDLITRRERVLRCDLQLFSPSISHSNNQLVSVGVAPDGAQFLVFFNLINAKEATRISFPLGVALQTPCWGGTDSVVAYTKVDSTGKSLCVYDLKTGSEVALIAKSAIDFSTPVYWGKYVLFSSYNSQVNNIFGIDTVSKKLYRITSSKFGCENPSISPNGNLLAFSCYTPNGYRLSLASMDTCQFNEINGLLGYRNPFELVIESRSVNPDTQLSVDNHSFTIEKYRKGLHLFRIHSWAPFFYDPLQINAISPEFKPGLTFVSQNILSTTTAVLGVSVTDNKPAYHARFIYEELFPVFSLSADYGELTMVYRDGNAKYYPMVEADRLEIAGSVSLPYNLTRNRFLRSIVPSVSISYSNDYLYFRTDSSYARNYTFITSRVVYYSHTPMAKRDIRAPWGKFIDLRFRYSPFESENMGSILSLQLKQMTPGFAANHSLMLSMGVQKQEVKKYYLSSTIPLPRGYLQFSTEQLLALSADYAFPLFYPDLALPSVLYLKRIRANFFGDWAKDGYVVYNMTQKRRETHFEYLYSYGVDFGFDYHLFRNAFPISTTLRFGNTRNNELFFNVFFGISFNN